MKKLIYILILIANIEAGLLLDKAVKICSIDYVKQTENVLQGLKKDHSPEFISLCREYVSLIKQLLDISNKISALQRNFLEITAVSALRNNLADYKQCLIQLNQLQPQYSNNYIFSEASRACSTKYIKDQNDLMRRMRSEKTGDFINHAKEFSDLIKIHFDISNRIESLERNTIDINVLANLRYPLEKFYKSCLVQNAGWML